MSSQQNYQMQYQKLLIQRQVFQTALANAPADRKADYQSALTYNSSQLAALERSQQLPAQTVSPMPSEPTSNTIQQGGKTWQKVTPAPTQYPAQTPNLNSPLQQGILGHNPNVFKATGAGGITPIINTQEKANIALAVAAPLIGPVVGVSATSVLIGEAIGIGLNEVPVTNVFFGQPITLPNTPQEAFERGTSGAAQGGVFSLVGGAAFKGIGIAGKTLGVGLPQGAKGVAASVLGKAAVNAGIGGGASYITSGGNLEAAGKGAAFGAAFSFIMEPVSYAGNRLQLSQRVFGVKATELFSVKEIETQRQLGGKFYIERLTTPTTREVRLPFKEAKYYSELLRYSQNPRVSLAGSEKIIQRSGKEYSLFSGEKGVTNLTSLSREGGGLIEGIKGTEYKIPRASEANRSATPIIKAIKGEPYKLGEVRLGKVNDFIKTPSEGLAVQKTKVSVGTKGKTKIPEIFAEKTVIPQGSIIAPESKLTIREFTGVQLSAKVSPEAYVKIAKSLPTGLAERIYSKLGGSSKPLVEISNPKHLAETLKQTQGFYDVSDLKGFIARPTEGMKVYEPETLLPNKTKVSKPFKPIETQFKDILKSESDSAVKNLLGEIGEPGNLPFKFSEGPAAVDERTSVKNTVRSKINDFITDKQTVPGKARLFERRYPNEFTVKENLKINNLFKEAQAQIKNPSKPVKYKVGSGENMKPLRGSIGSSPSELNVAMAELTKQQATANELRIKFVKPIIKVDLKTKGTAWSQTASASNIWRSQRYAQADAEEITLTYPENSPLSAPNILNVLQNRQGQKDLNTLIQGQTSRQPTKISNVLSNIVDISPATKQRDSINNIFDQGQILRQPQITIPGVTTKPDTLLGTIPLLNMRAPPRLNAPFLGFPGGGGSELGRTGLMGGVWFRRTHAIPNPDKVLNQVLGKRKSHRKQSSRRTQSKSNIRIKINVGKR